MLILTRKSQESIVVCEAGGLNPVLKVTVLEVNGGKVRLGFEVDPRVPIHRLEVWERIRSGGQARGPAGEAASSVT